MDEFYREVKQDEQLSKLADKTEEEPQLYEGEP